MNLMLLMFASLLSCHLVMTRSIDMANNSEEAEANALESKVPPPPDYEREDLLAPPESDYEREDLRVASDVSSDEGEKDEDADFET